MTDEMLGISVMDQAGTADIIEILEMLPHRPPFLLIDRVVDIRPDHSACGIKNVTINEPFFVGHFPTRPIMPGVLIIEAMAQTSAVLVVRTEGEALRGKLVYFMSIDQARFRRPVTPGDVLALTVTKNRRRGPVWKFDAVAEVDGIRVAEAVITAMIME